MFAYLLLASVGLIAFWLYYYFLLRKTTFFTLKRWYFLCVIIFCAAVPFTYELVSIESGPTNAEHANAPSLGAVAANNIREVKEDLREISHTARDQAGWISIIYFTVCGLLLLRSVWSIIAIRRLSKGAEITSYKGITVFKTKHVKQPLSLFKSIYIPAEWQGELPNEILLHEQAHVKQRHFLDLLTVECLTIVFWFNPITYFYKKSMRLNLEYLADRAAVSHGNNVWQYQSLLLSHALTGNYNSITTNFFSTPLKNRIDMMKKKNSKKWLRLSVLGVLPIAAFLVAMNTRSETTPPIRHQIVEITEGLNGDNRPSRSPFDKNITLRVTAGFGPRVHPILKKEQLHKGVDFSVKAGTPIYATAAGTMEIAENDEMHGNYVQIKHSDKYQTRYSHMSKMAVKADEEVKKGQLIGYVGSTGASTAPHLHYEVRENGKPINPEKFLTNN